MAGRLGLPLDQGVIVSDVIPGSPAETAGLKIQDIILSMDDRPVGSLPVFATMLMSRAGDRMKIQVLRGSGKMQVEVPVAQHQHNVDLLAGLVDPGKNLISKLGVLGIEIDKKISQMLPGLRQPSGVIVAAKVAGFGGEENSLAVGDVIHALNGMTVISLDSLHSTLDAIKPGSPVVLQIEREGILMCTSFRMD
jgi:serine protease Do